MENNKIIIKDYSMNDIQSKVTIIIDENKAAWFKGCEVASILGYSDKKQAIRKNVDIEDKMKLNELMGCINTTTLNSQPHTIYINESGLYCLVIRSKLKNDMHPMKKVQNNENYISL